jgi:hypothetical protein
MKIVGIAIVRADSGVPEPIPITVACDLTSYGFFQRQVSHCGERKSYSDVIGNGQENAGIAVGFYVANVLCMLSLVYQSS